MTNNIDLDEYSQIEDDRLLLETLLADMSTHQNIVWGTDDYQKFGAGYSASDYILPLFLLSSSLVIHPRVFKSVLEKKMRSQEKAEVFTPSWIVNRQNNLADDAWIGKKGTFNTEIDRDWIPSEKTELGERWKEYVASERLEVCCGEAPYLTSRYDSVEGTIIPVEKRVGFYDRKLRVISENVDTKESWLRYAEIATQNVYGYDLQGDNVLLSRENILLSFIEAYNAKFDDTPDREAIMNTARILAWNIWQMDGEKMIVPFSCSKPRSWATEDFGLTAPCTACKTGKGRHTGVYCRIKDWKKDETCEFSKLINGGKKKKSKSPQVSISLDKWL